MPDDSMPLEQREVEIPQIHDEDFSVVYTNWIQAGRTAWDIALAFGQVGERDPGHPAVIRMVNVVMTPQMAKALVSTLAVTIKQYEKENGEILLPESIRPKVSASASPSSSPSPSASPSPENEEED